MWQTFSDLIELVPNLVWLIPDSNHPLHSSNVEKPFYQSDDLLKAIQDVIPDHHLSPIKPNPSFKHNYIQILRKHVQPKHDVFSILEESPSIVWTTIVVTTIHLLFEFFR